MLLHSSSVLLLLNESDHQLADCHAAQQDIKARARSNKRTKQREDARDLQSQLPASLQLCMELSQE